MTQVDFHFISPDGAPIANGQVEVRLAGEAFRDVESGVVVPRILRETTDAEGRLSLDLWPLETAEYTATALDPVSGRRARYSFYVPESEVPVRMQDLVMLPSPSPKKYDEASIAVIQAERILSQDAVSTAQAEASSAAMSAASASESASTAQTEASSAMSARQAAELARDDAQTAEDHAAASATEAGNHAGAADSARSASDGFAAEALSYRDDAQSAAKDSLDSALDAERHATRAAETHETIEDDEYVFGVMDEDLNVALGIRRDGSVKAEGLLDKDFGGFVDRESGEYGQFVGGIVDDQGNLALGVDVHGDLHVGAVEYETRDRNPSDYGGQDVLFPITDEDGRLVFGVDGQSGEIIGKLKQEATSNDEIIRDVEALGGRGTITQASILDADFYRYSSDAAGGTLPFRRKREGSLRAHILDTSQEVGIHISYGQSWRTLSFDGMRSFVGDAENERNITLFKEGGTVEGPIGTGAGISIGGNLTDLANISTDESFSLGRIAVISYLRQQDQHRMRKAPVAEFCHGWPGSTWDSGGGGGLAPGGDSWANGLILMDAMTAQLQAYGKTPVYRSVAWTQGGAGGKDVTGNIADLKAMMQAYDDLNLPGTDTQPLNFYIGMPGGNANTTEMSDGMKAWLQVCRNNENGRSWMPTPWYPWEYRQTDPADNIHTGPYGTVRHGEMEGYAKFCVEDLGLDWNPLWHSRSEAITLSGDTIVIPFERVTGPAFETAKLEWDVETIEQAESYGFRVFVDGVKASIASVEITGLESTEVTIVLETAPAAGASVEVSYAARDGVAQPSGGHSGLWGNLIMRGATSPLNSRWTLDAWACQFIETLIA